MRRLRRLWTPAVHSHGTGAYEDDGSRAGHGLLAHALAASPSGIHIMHSQAPAAWAYNHAKARACGLITAGMGGDMTGTDIKTAPRRGQEGAGHWTARAALPGRAS